MSVARVQDYIIHEINMAKSHQELIIDVSLDDPKMSCLKAGQIQVCTSSPVPLKGRTDINFKYGVNDVLFLFRRDSAATRTSRTYIRVIESTDLLAQNIRVALLTRCYPPVSHYKTFHKTMQFFLSSSKKRQKTACDNTEYHMKLGAFLYNSLREKASCA